MSERSKSVRIKPRQADVCGGASPNIDMLPDEQAHTCTMIAIDASDQAKTRIPRALSDPPLPVSLAGGWEGYRMGEATWADWQAWLDTTNRSWHRPYLRNMRARELGLTIPHRHPWHVSWDKVMREQSRQDEASR